MKKIYSKQEEVRAIIEWTIRADSKEEAEELFDQWECEDERVIDILETIEDFWIQWDKE